MNERRATFREHDSLTVELLVVSDQPEPGRSGPGCSHSSTTMMGCGGKELRRLTRVPASLRRFANWISCFCTCLVP